MYPVYVGHNIHFVTDLFAFLVIFCHIVSASSPNGCAYLLYFFSSWKHLKKTHTWDLFALRCSTFFHLPRNPTAPTMTPAGGELIAPVSRLFSKHQHVQQVVVYCYASKGFSHKVADTSTGNVSFLSWGLVSSENLHICAQYPFF